MVRLALLWCIIYAWDAVEWQLGNEDENGSLLWRENKPFPLTGAWGLSSSPLRTWGTVVALWVAVLEHPAERLWCLGGLSGASDQWICFVSISITLFRVEITCVCAKLLASRTRNRIAISSAEAVSKGSFLSLTTFTGLVIYYILFYLLCH